MRCAAIKLFVGCVVLAWATGCDSKPSQTEAARLIGSWESSQESTVTNNGKESKGPPLTLTMSFRADGTLSGEMLFAIKGTWKLLKAEGNKLTLDIEMGLDNEEMKGDPNLKEQKNKDTFTIVFENDDQMTMTPAKNEKEAVTFKRKK